MCVFFLIAFHKAFRYSDDIYIIFIRQGKRISFYKRAQILVADTWSVLEGEGDGCFEVTASATMAWHLHKNVKGSISALAGVAQWIEHQPANHWVTRHSRSPKDLHKQNVPALAGVAQWIEHRPANQRVAGLIPHQGTCLGC